MSKQRWSMPAWMKPFAEHITNTGNNSMDRVAVVVQLYNGNTDPLINLPLSTIEAMVIAQVHLLIRLHRLDMLPRPTGTAQ